MSDVSLLRINVKEVLRFFDEKPDWSDKHATGVVGIVGEDLNTACFQHYIKSKGGVARVLREPKPDKPLKVTTGKPTGPRLDRWIKVDWADESKTVFQAEIKNWSAWAIGGEILRVDATPDEVDNYKHARWEGRWHTPKHTLRASHTAKVLVRMKPPHGVDKETTIRPLLILWEAIAPRDQTNNHLFCINAPTLDFPFSLPPTWPNPYKSPELWGFPELWIFSVSSYLRSVSDASIELNMPDAVARLGILSRLFPADA